MFALKISCVKFGIAKFHAHYLLAHIASQFLIGVRVISTSRLNTLLCLHLKPINLIIY